MLMLHQSEGQGGMSTAWRWSIRCRYFTPRGGFVVFAPGGYHLMCTDPHAQMKPGAHVPVVLTLSDGSSVAASFAVRDARGK